MPDMNGRIFISSVIAGLAITATMTLLYPAPRPPVLASSHTSGSTHEGPVEGDCLGGRRVR